MHQELTNFNWDFSTILMVVKKCDTEEDESPIFFVYRTTLSYFITLQGFAKQLHNIYGKYDIPVNQPCDGSRS